MQFNDKIKSLYYFIVAQGDKTQNKKSSIIHLAS